MPTQHEMAERWIRGAMRRIRETGEPQQSKDWGYGDRKRCVTIMSYDPQANTYEASLLCWGFQEKVVTGNWGHVFSECLEALSQAG